jgi:UDP-2,3-diacylglucosamine pyrophosphatase LpxH
MKKREIEIVVISDVHLGTYGCHATELVSYLKSIKPKILVLNGDIFDIWQMKKSWFPADHLEVVRKILKMSNDGTKVYYITGNHDDALRQLSDTRFGNFELRDYLLIKLNNKVFWFFHGDVFDLSIQHARWLAKLGGHGYDILIRMNRYLNKVRAVFGIGPASYASKIKASVKKATKTIQDFEQLAIDQAIQNNYDYVICGHIHTPQIRQVETEHGSTVYLNSGDWVEHLTALEYQNEHWQIYKYDALEMESINPKLHVKAKNKTKSLAQVVPSMEVMVEFAFIVCPVSLLVL